MGPNEKNLDNNNYIIAATMTFRELNQGGNGLYIKGFGGKAPKFCISGYTTPISSRSTNIAMECTLLIRDTSSKGPFSSQLC